MGAEPRAAAQRNPARNSDGGRRGGRGERTHAWRPPARRAARWRPGARGSQVAGGGRGGEGGGGGGGGEILLGVSTDADGGRGACVISASGTEPQRRTPILRVNRKSLAYMT